MNMLKNAKDVSKLLETVAKCEGEVILRKNDGSEEFNLKSTLSMYMAIGELARDHGDQWEVWCMNKADERHFLGFFVDLKTNV